MLVKFDDIIVTLVKFELRSFSIKDRLKLLFDDLENDEFLKVKSLYE